MYLYYDSPMFKDPIMQQLVETLPPPNYEDRSSDLMQALIRSIISQQLSVKAARTIFHRFKDYYGTDFPTAEQIEKSPDDEMRAVGLSYSKISYIKSVANAFISGLIVQEKIKQQEDEEVIQELIQIKGIGRWTAEMILIFALRRPDVFSIDDNGVQRAITKLYGITDKKEMLRLSEQWKPHRSAACWYLWRSLEAK
jgi:DNA-3-methyladenine glycosylase II